MEPTLAEALRAENARLLRVVDAALTWWRRHRPVDWDEAEHLRYPLVNTTTDAEKDLARAVADYVAAHGHKTEDAC